MNRGRVVDCDSNIISQKSSTPKLSAEQPGFFNPVFDSEGVSVTDYKTEVFRIAIKSTLGVLYRRQEYNPVTRLKCIMYLKWGEPREVS